MVVIKTTIKIEIRINSLVSLIKEKKISKKEKQKYERKEE